jgi:hypothetical protein
MADVRASSFPEGCEALVGADIEAFLRDPGQILAELDGTAERATADAIAETEALTLSRRLDQLAAERTQMILGTPM